MSHLYLAHHGIKGMKWGVRRFQNKDGSLTSAGERRYSEMSRKEQRAYRKEARNYRDEKMQDYKERLVGLSDGEKYERARLSNKSTEEKAELNRKKQIMDLHGDTYEFDEHGYARVRDNPDGKDDSRNSAVKFLSDYARSSMAYQYNADLDAHKVTVANLETLDNKVRVEAGKRARQSAVSKYGDDVVSDLERNEETAFNIGMGITLAAGLGLGAVILSKK